MSEQGQPPPGWRVGRWMLGAAWIIGLLLAAQWFSHWEASRNNPNRSPVSQSDDGYVEVVLDRGRGGHYLSRGSINGRAVTFLLDTGATTVAVPARLVRELALPLGPPMRVSTANGEIDARYTRLDSVQLGEIQLHNVAATILPDTVNDDEVLLGMSALGKLQLSTQGNNQLVLRQYMN